MNQDISSQLIDYLEGKLSITNQRKLEELIAKDPSLEKELKELRLLFGQMDLMEDMEPPIKLKTRFENYLHRETLAHRAEKSPVQKNSVFRLRKLDWSIAAAVAVLIIGIAFGNLWQKNRQQQAQINQLIANAESTRKILFLAMLDQNSASERIKALNAVNPSEGDPQILEALMNTLHYDDNVNVRMKAAEALAVFSNRKLVVDALIKALNTQENPEIQITIIDLLVEANAKRAVDGFQELLKRENLMDVVKSKAAHGIEKLL